MNYIFILSSVTYALKGKKLLEENGIKASLVKSGNIKELRGCGYGLKVEYRERTKAEAILLESGIRIIGFSGESQ
ncbi:MAG: DUF3343 domain-containing protein [Ruminococcaceae bacterium]|nr:DUF3343 domain-containing protein [Oscillospiraceae bacterium]